MNAFGFIEQEPTLSRAANRCLGEIGPINLSTLVLTPIIEMETRRHQPGTAEINTTANHALIQNLVKLLVHEDNCTLLAAAQALKHILATGDGEAVLDMLAHNNNNLLPILNPFINALSSTTIDINAISKRACDVSLDTHMEHDKFMSSVDSDTLWCQFKINPMYQNITSKDKWFHENWIRDLVTSLLECMTKKRLSQFKQSPILGRHLLPICNYEPNLCEKIFPDLILDIFRRHFLESKDTIRSVISKHICNFLKKHYDDTYRKLDGHIQEVDTPFMNVLCIQLILDVVEYLRMHNIPVNNEAEDGSIRRTGSRNDISTTSVWQNNFWICNINYLHVARAALDCNSYFAACLYCDLWCQRIKETCPELENEFSTMILNSSLLDTLHDTFEGNSELLKDIKRCQSILFEAYSKLGDNEAIYGCGSSRLFDKKSRIQNAVVEQKHLEAFSMFDKLIQVQKDTQSELLDCLLSSGCYHTLDNYTKGVQINEGCKESKLKNYQYECAWRLSKWEDIEDFHEDINTFPKYRHLALQGLFLRNDMTSFDDGFEMASQSVSKMLSSKIENTNMGIKTETSPVSILQGLTYLRCLNEASLLVKLGPATTAFDLDEILSGLETFDNDLSSTDFSYVEPIWNQRQVILRNILNKNIKIDIAGISTKNFPNSSNKEFQNAILKACVNQSFQLCKLAIKQHHFHVAENSLIQIKHLITQNKKDHGSLIEVEDEIQYNEALLAWASKEYDVAKFLMKSLNRKLEQDKENIKRTTLLPEVLRTLGSWMFTLKSESSNVILESYLKRSTRLYEELCIEGKAKLSNNHQPLLIDEEKITQAYASLATFCDDQYKNIMNYMQSKDFEDKHSLMKQIQEEGRNIKKVGSTADDSRKAAMILERHSNLDLSEMQSMEKDRLSYLALAVENYAKALAVKQNSTKVQCSDRSTYHDLRIFRLISLWFSNAKHSNINVILNKYMQSIPSYKFTSLLYQLCARMVMKAADGVHAKEFPQLLLRLIKRCAIDHPHQTLPIVFALANSNADEKEIEGASARKGSISKNEERTEAAQKLLDVLASNTSLSQLIQRMRTVAEGYIKLAYLPMSTKDKQRMERPGTSSGLKIEIEKNQKLRSIRNYDDVPLTTMDLAINREAEYPLRNFVGISSFSTEYSTVGGITAPKKIRCLGTDGKWRPQLVKGKDDLRQDAVMQQVFNLLNSLLAKDDLAQKRRLQMRTYKVVAMSQRSGVLEWCENTTPIREFLVGSDQISGAHARYYPGDLKAMQCRKLLTDAQKQKDLKFSLKKFEEICRRFHPVMRHFFYENFPSPGIHMERRLAYTRSAATSSMVGYILGLGDRHVQNILLDMSTAELIHIDLGVAFEQGKILPTPETIPFRLSRDIIDGFGPSGVEGTFRRSCETTLNILRANKEGIMTILEVLIYDPLYNWSLTPAKAYKLQYGREADSSTRSKWERDQLEQDQQNNASRNNKMAERVLLRVTQKLNGMEDGYRLSTEGQVNLLIQQATDPSRLCALFPGWQPYI